MQIRKRDMFRDNWAGVRRYTQTSCLTREEGFCGMLGLMHMLEVEKPLVFDLDGQKVRAVDDGFYWLQMAPRDEDWWLTVMFDPDGLPVQAYFDITGENHILPDGKSWFTDLFLDVVVQPDGRIRLLDEDELEQALREGVITVQQHDRAVRQAGALTAALDGHTEQFFAWAGTYFRRLLCRLPA